MAKQRDRNSRLLGFARTMRHEATDAERKLWSILCGRRLGGFKFRRHVLLDGFIADFYCIERNVVVEADGGQHLDDSTKDYDARRTARLNTLGIRVLRLPDDEIL